MTQGSGYNFSALHNGCGSSEPSSFGNGSKADSNELFMTPSTESQREIWTSAKMGLDATLAFNESIYLRFTGKLDVPALKRALLLLVERHESLRATFSVDGTMFCVLPNLIIDISYVDLSLMDDRDIKLESLLRNEVETPFDLERGPLFRAQIIKISAEEQVLVMTAHHIICDGWSYAVLLKDLANLYMPEVTGQSAELPPVHSFSDYAKLMQERASTAEHLADEIYWLDSFKTLPSNIDLPAVRLRPSFKTYTSRREDYTLDKELVSSIKKTGAKMGCSFVQTLLAGFNVLLHRLSGQEDLVVGFLSAGQASSGQSNLVGHCVNTLPLRVVIDDKLSFASFLKSVKKTMLDAYEHQQYTFGSLLQKLKLPRDPARLPLCSILFNVDQTIDANKLGFQELDVQFHSNPREYENFEMFVNAVDHAGSIVLELQYNSDLFDTQTIHHYMSCFETLLRGIVNDPAEEICRLPILSCYEQEKIILQWNTTEATFPVEETLHGLFMRQAAQTPEHPAVSFECNNALSYQILDERSNQLAHYLQNQGVGRGSLVGLCVDRSEEMLISTLAVLKAGAAYVPLDPAYPAERLGYMISNSGLQLILSQSWLGNTLPKHQAHVLLLDAETTTISAQSTATPAAQSEPEDPAYVIYTSGSTGKPKGVIIPHRAVVNFLTSMRRKPGIKESDVLVAVTTLSFDIAVLELYLPIVTGAKTVIASRETSLDGLKLLELMKQSAATIMQATPATWRLLILSGWEKSMTSGADFKVLCGGEALQHDLAEQILMRADSLWNMYGPTETTIWSTCEQIHTDKLSVSIGKPIDNTQLYILDPLLQPVPVGVAGELYIGGAGVSLGYLHRPDLTTERFVSNPYFDPFAEILSPLLYKTGDVARYLPDGRVEYIGRNGNQVKVRGYRIELGEIETILSQYPKIQQCVVMIREDNPGDVRIAAYVIPKPGAMPDFDAVRAWLRTSLPDYMIPQHFQILDSFPQTWNGKIDLKAFLPPADSNTIDDEEEFAQPASEAELLVAKIWTELLGKERICLHDNFFNLGGHSLLSVQFITRLQQETGYRLNPRLVLLNTLGQIARQVAANSNTDTIASNDSNESPGVVRGLWNRLLSKKGVTAEKPAQAVEQGIVKRKPSVKAPLSLKQERLWTLEQQNPGQTAYNLPSAFRMKGPLNLPALQMSLNEVIRRHEIMRTTFTKNTNGILEQDVAAKLDIDLSPHDLSHLPPESQESQLMAMLANEAALPFDLAHGPLLRASLYQLGPLDNVLFFMPHHAIWDGWSFDIFLSEMATLYEAFSNDKPSLPPNLELQYGDFSAWQRDHLTTNRVAKEQEFWLKELSAPLPVLTLPQQKQNQSGASYSGAMHELLFSKKQTDELAAMGRKAGVPLSIVLLSAYNALLHAYSHQQDILVGVPLLGRNEASVKNMIGCFVNTLPVRTRFTGEDMTFRQLIDQLEDKALEIYQYQDLTTEELMADLEKAGHDKRDSLIQTTFSFQDASQRATRFSDLVLEQFLLHSRGVAFDISLWLKSCHQGLTGAIEYRTDLFDASAIKTMASDFATLLDTVLKNPDIKLSQLAHAPKQEQIEPRNQPEPMPVKAVEIKPVKPKNPLYFNSGDQQLFGIYHPARSKTVCNKAILLCYPVGQEYIRSHWVFLQLASQLASAGFPVLRFDYYASGDSYGESSDGNIRQWKTDVVSAAKQLQSLSGLNQISIVGLRFGSTLAALAAKEGLALQDLILWDPVFSGRDYLDEIKNIHNLLFPHAANALEEIMGYPYPIGLQQQIADINLSDLSGINANTLILGTGEREPEPFQGKATYHYVKDAGDWEKLSEAHTRLICPTVVQTIVNLLAGRVT